jgi:hypothetical protein
MATRYNFDLNLPGDCTGEERSEEPIDPRLYTRSKYKYKSCVIHTITDEIDMDTMGPTHTSLIATELLQHLIQWSRCGCGKPLDYTIIEYIAQSISVQVVCKEGHVFESNADLNRYQSNTTLALINCLPGVSLLVE